jgi:hypothetical protein
MKYVVIAILWGSSVYYLMGIAFTEGFQQGYSEGKAAATPTEQQVFLQCAAWWFNGSAPSVKTAIDQYCNRRKK